MTRNSDNGAVSLLACTRGGVQVALATLLRWHVRTVRASRWEILVGAVLLLGAATIGTVYGVTMLPKTPEQPTQAAGDAGTFVDILKVNVPAALFLYSGIVTLGVTALAAGAGVGLYLGHSIALSVATLGPARVFSRTFLYTPFELYAFVLALASGLTPVSWLLGSRGVISAYMVVRQSLTLLGQALLLLLAAALFETVSIAVAR